MSKPLSEMTREELWRLFPVQLSEHNPNWATWYAEERSRIIFLLERHIVRIDHIGSTFVKGLIAKPIVDILLQVKPETDLDTVRAVLLNDGWLLMAQNSDFGELDLNKGYTPDGFAEKVYHLHVRREGDCDELHFRDYLVGNPIVAAEYSRLKQELLAKYEYNRDAYTEAKTAFVKAYSARAKAESR